MNFFIGVTTCATKSLGILVHNELNFLSVFGTLDLKVTDTPGTTKVLGSNRTGPYFFSNRNFLFQNNSRSIICLLSCLMSADCHISAELPHIGWVTTCRLSCFVCWAASYENSSFFKQETFRFKIIVGLSFLCLVFVGLVAGFCCPPFSFYFS